MPVRVLIVDDHTLVRAGLARLLQGFADVQLVAEASNAEQALQLSLSGNVGVTGCRRRCRVSRGQIRFRGKGI